MHGIQGHVGAARLQYGKHGHEHVQRALHRHAHELAASIRSVHMRAQQVRQLIRSAIQFVVAQGPIEELRGNGAGGRFRLQLR
jgi:hypothetical protein